MLEDVVLPIIAILSVFVFCPLAIAYSIRLVRKSPEPQEFRGADEISRRLIEMQHTMDSMAVEVERISEGQRFITKVMSERPAAELPAPKRAASRRES